MYDIFLRVPELLLADSAEVVVTQICDRFQLPIEQCHILVVAAGTALHASPDADVEDDTPEMHPAPSVQPS